MALHQVIDTLRNKGFAIVEVDEEFNLVYAGLNRKLDRLEVEIALPLVESHLITQDGNEVRIHCPF